MMAGVVAFFAGLKLLLEKAELRAVLWRMLGLLLVMMALISVGVYFLVDYLAAMWIPEGDAWYWVVVGWLAWLLALLLAGAGGIAAYVLLATSVAAPWLDTLAERVEQMHGVKRETPDYSPLMLIMQSATNSIRPLGGLLLWGIAALLCLWLPPLATALWTWGSIRFLSYELIDVPASRRALHFAERKQALDSKRWFYLGFGGLAMVLLMVPFLNLLVIPAAVVALAKQMPGETQAS